MSIVIRNGLRLSDLHEITVGMVIDLAISNANRYAEENEGENEREATQEDIDNFIKRGY